MSYELIFPDKKEGSIDYAGIVSLPTSNQISDLLFVKDWGATLIRPSLDKEGTSQKDISAYIKKIDSILRNLKNRFSNVIFIDVRIDSDMQVDVALNSKSCISERFIDPLINNMKMTSWSFSRDLTSELDLLKKVCKPEEGIHGFQLVISDKLFKRYNSEGKPLALIAFEENLIYAHLAVMGKV